MSDTTTSQHPAPAGAGDWQGSYARGMFESSRELDAGLEVTEWMVLDGSDADAVMLLPGLAAI